MDDDFIENVALDGTELNKLVAIDVAVDNEVEDRQEEAVLAEDAVVGQDIRMEDEDQI